MLTAEEEARICERLAATGGNVSRTARETGYARGTVRSVRDNRTPAGRPRRRHIREPERLPEGICPQCERWGYLAEGGGRCIACLAGDGPWEPAPAAEPIEPLGMDLRGPDRRRYIALCRQKLLARQTWFEEYGVDPTDKELAAIEAELKRLSQ